MKANMGTVDKILRVLIAVTIAVLYFTGTISGALAIVLAVIGILFLLTSMVGFCPAYRLFGISTNKKQV